MTWSTRKAYAPSSPGDAAARERRAYELGVAGPAARAIADKLPEAVSAAVLEFINGPLLDNPQRARGPLFETYTARRGSYRVLYTIDEERRLVTVKDVEHLFDVSRRR